MDMAYVGVIRGQSMCPKEMNSWSWLRRRIHDVKVSIRYLQATRGLLGTDGMRTAKRLDVQ